MAGTDEDGVRTAADRLGRAHRGMNAEGPGRIVGGCDDSPAVRIAADDERVRAQLRVLELLDRSVERVEIEVGDDHRLRLIQASGGLDRLLWWRFSRRRSSAAPTSSRAVRSAWLRSWPSCGSAPSRSRAVAARRRSSVTVPAAS